MAAVGTKDALAREIQTRIDLLQAELHKHVKNVVVAGNLKRNAHYTARQEIITKAIESGELPRTFWADAIVAALETPEVAEGNEGRLLGNYDAALLREYLQEVKVEYTEAGVKVMLTFAPNPFFQETVWWGGSRHYAGDEEEKREKEKTVIMRPKTRTTTRTKMMMLIMMRMTFAASPGITWKPGHGPEDDGNDHTAAAAATRGMDKGRNGTSRETRAVASYNAGVEFS
ncbi:putative nucleosome assembly protein (NAP) [Trypanosoma cruzi]|nr:putative nucleosome assembly protein (NAP) [Trypanosoma cruzi]